MPRRVTLMSRYGDTGLSSGRSWVRSPLEAFWLQPTAAWRPSFGRLTCIYVLSGQRDPVSQIWRREFCPGNTFCPGNRGVPRATALPGQQKRTLSHRRKFPYWIMLGSTGAGFWELLLAQSSFFCSEQKCQKMAPQQGSTFFSKNNTTST